MVETASRSRQVHVEPYLKYWPASGARHHARNGL